MLCQRHRRWNSIKTTLATEFRAHPLYLDGIRLVLTYLINSPRLTRVRRNKVVHGVERGINYPAGMFNVIKAPLHKISTNRRRCSNACPMPSISKKEMLVQCRFNAGPAVRMVVTDTDTILRHSKINL